MIKITKLNKIFNENTKKEFHALKDINIENHIELKKTKDGVKNIILKQ